MFRHRLAIRPAPASGTILFATSQYRMRLHFSPFRRRRPASVQAAVMISASRMAGAAAGSIQVLNHSSRMIIAHSRVWW